MPKARGYTCVHWEACPWNTSQQLHGSAASGSVWAALYSGFLLNVENLCFWLLSQIWHEPRVSNTLQKSSVLGSHAAAALQIWYPPGKGLARWLPLLPPSTQPLRWAVPRGQLTQGPPTCQPARPTLAFLSCPLPFQLLSHYRFHSISMLKPPPRLLIKMWNKIKPNPQSLSYDCSKPGSLNIICQQWITPALGPKLIGSQGEGCKAFGCTICSREGTPFKVWPIKSL